MKPTKILPILALMLLSAFSSASSASSPLRGRSISAFPTSCAPPSAFQAQDAPTLTIGSSAPPLTIAKWLKGDPIEGFRSNQVYAVVFWATWCSSFIPVIQHLSDLQRLYDGQAQVLAISVFETSQARVIGYVNSEADKMKFTVGMDKVPADVKSGWLGGMVSAWLKPAAQEGLPIAFIVDKEGKIAWIGSPVGDSMDEPLRKTVNGTWDRAAFAEKYASVQERDRAIREISDQIKQSIESNDWEGALKHADELLPYDKGASVGARYLVLLRKGDFANAYDYVAHLLDGPFGNDPLTLYSLAWLTVNPQAHWEKSDFDLGVKLAKRACDLTFKKNADMLDTLAWAYYGKKDKPNAVAAEKDALAVAREDQKYKIQQNLDTFEKGG